MPLQTEPWSTCTETTTLPYDVVPPALKAASTIQLCGVEEKLKLLRHRLLTLTRKFRRPFLIVLARSASGDRRQPLVACHFRRATTTTSTTSTPSTPSTQLETPPVLPRLLPSPFSPYLPTHSVAALRQTQHYPVQRTLSTLLEALPVAASAQEGEPAVSPMWNALLPAFSPPTSRHLDVSTSEPATADTMVEMGRGGVNLEKLDSISSIDLLQVVPVATNVVGRDRVPPSLPTVVRRAGRTSVSGHLRHHELGYPRSGNPPVQGQEHLQVGRLSRS